MSICIKIDNLHKKISFSDVFRLVKLFGEINGFVAHGESFIFRFTSLKDNILNLNHLSLGGKRIQVSKTSYQGDFDSCLDLHTQFIFFPAGEYDPEDIKNECIRYGSIQKVTEEQNGINVECTSPSEASNIFYNIYGRFYNSKRIRCVLLQPSSPKKRFKSNS